MKTYRELYFKGNDVQLENFIENIRNYAIGDWQCIDKTDQWKDYLFIEYLGTDVEKARVSIYIGSIGEKDELKVGNIIPIEKNQLSVNEYNEILMKFYKDVITPYKKNDSDINIEKPSGDIFDPTSIITEAALRKLEGFCSAANKSTGASHPLDRERWLDFICQTVDDGRMFDYTSLFEFLKDEDYWGEKPNSYIGVMGKYAWDEEQASELASEYESACGVIEYYKNSRGI